MNDEHQENLELRRMLEEAMPMERAEAGAGPLDSLDPETAALRRAWQRFRELLEAGGPTEIERAAGNILPIVEKVEAQKEAGSSEKARRAPRRFRWSAVALAASLLVAVGLAVTLRIVENLKDRAAVQPKNPSAVARGDKTAVPNQIARNPNDTTARPTNKNADVAANNDATDSWNDSVDDDITAVARATALVKQDWYAQSGSIGAVETGVSDLSRELDQGPL